MVSTGLHDRRRHPRTIAIAGTAVLSVDGARSFFAVENISPTGALLVGDLQLAVGDPVHLQRVMATNLNVPLEAWVIHSDRVDDGSSRFRIGVAFVDVPVGLDHDLRNIVVAARERSRATATHAVLILDDDSHVRTALARTLRGIGRSPLQASTLLGFLGLVQDPGTIFDVAFVDLHLGHDTGLDALAYLATDHPAIGRVLMSSDIDPDVRDRELRSGRAHAFLAKPWTRESLAEIMRPWSRETLCSDSRINSA